MRTRRILFGLLVAIVATAAGPLATHAAAEDALPAYSPYTLEMTHAAIDVYRQIEDAGGWPAMTGDVLNLKRGSTGTAVALLKRRLALTGDLDPADLDEPGFGGATEEALKRFQARHGLSQTGRVGRLTIRALSAPVEQRLKQLEATAQRLENDGFVFSHRYVVVNIPGADVEAVEDDRVVRRYTAVVGRKDRRSPVLATRITAVNLNPTWTAPLSIVRRDIMPKVRENPGFLAESNMRVLRNGVEVSPASVDWSGRTAVNFIIRQDPGPTNALGSVRLDMPNPHAVFIHDTPKKDLFRSDVRFHSSGCARVLDVADLAAWLLEGTPWTPDAIAAQIATTERRDIRLARPVPVAWVYLTGWATGDGTVQFRDDIYGLDTPEGIALTTIGPPKTSSMTTASRAAEERVAEAPWTDVSWADAR